MIKLTEYTIASWHYVEAINVWIDYDEGGRSISYTYDHLNKLFDNMIENEDKR